MFALCQRIQKRHLVMLIVMLKINKVFTCPV
uniref:Uncharacterized protein n=1 Tax=Arundo donax TaxID=35708 RepID=A0A0A9CDJ2_ARUDO